MKNVLHIISSARGSLSHSKGLSSAIVKKLMDKNDIKTVVEKDLTKEFPPFIDPELIGEFYKHPDSILEDGKQLFTYANTIFNEINDADIIVIGTPMHNLGISAPLKAWIDQLIRFGITYRYDSDGVRTGVFKGKKVYLAIASGGKLSDWPNQNEYIESYIKTVFNAYMGISDIYTFRVESTANTNLKIDYQTFIHNI
ncbi:FMN-dependent NADH-azoreductase [Pedobacter polaris]|uniref:FMN dependent NADH:quinone oxidoreductase n=1 Tax=Pedobacter polaris TaxID=2571273 RepID=A0A4U1CFY1_9SPHI|nr:NAD(P)H-dependent oxidoreductase [Pedobacter polaris]TKC05549.1 FMN-dependent NADH-azoreductase [Pedobacter polaris]